MTTTRKMGNMLAHWCIPRPSEAVRKLIVITRYSTEVVELYFTRFEVINMHRALYAACGILYSSYL